MGRLPPHHADWETCHLPYGTRVRIVGPSYAGTRDWIGLEGHITHDRQGCDYLVALHDDSGGGTTFPCESLELLDSERREGE